jgi:hypothetical protein
MPFDGSNGIRSNKRAIKLGKITICIAFPVIEQLGLRKECRDE